MGKPGDPAKDEPVAEGTADAPSPPEPWAAANVVVLGVVVVGALALLRVFRVGHNDPGTALGIFGAIGGLAPLLGILLSDLQRFVEMAFILAVILYLRAEYPKQGRYEHEVNVLAILLTVLWVAVVIVGSAPVAIVSLLIGVPHVVLQVLRAMLPEKPKEPPEIPPGAPPWVRRFGAAQKRRMQRRASAKPNAPAPTGDVLKFNRRVRTVLLLLVSMFLVVTAESDRPWMPSESISVQGQSARVGFVVTDDGPRSELLILWDSSRRLDRVPTARIKDRHICQSERIAATTLPELLGAGSSGSPYPACPTP